MTKNRLRHGFVLFKKSLPRWALNPIRSFLIAFMTPILFSYRTGHFLSSFRMIPVSRRGKALPWYVYPAIDFLKYRSYEDKIVLEFGGGSQAYGGPRGQSMSLRLKGMRGGIRT